MLKNLATYLYFFIILLVAAGCSTENMQSVSNMNDEEIDAEEIIEKNLPPEKLRVHYIDVGQADATLLQFSGADEDFTILIDTGDWNAKNVVTYLHEQNIRTVDLVAITHPHADHLGQLDKIINEVNVTEVWMNGETANSQVFANSLEAIETNQVDYYEPEIGEVFDIGPLQIEVLHPKSLSSNTNNNSLAMRIQYGDVSFLFTGDAESQAEEEMLASGANLAATILHIGHHGSNTSSTPDFLETVNPEMAVYSAGVDNSYDHPDEEVINRINSSDILLYGTDNHGTIVVETDGLTYHVMTQKQGTLPRDTSNEFCVDINTASEEDLQQIIHIGPALANQLIDLRPFASIEELIKINGIGTARLKEIQSQELACIGG